MVRFVRALHAVEHRDTIAGALELHFLLRRGDAVTYFDRERNAFPARVASAGGAETYDEAMRPSYVVAVRRTTDASRLYRIPAG